MTGRLESMGRTLVIAPHPDDEILGAGGTMAALAKAGNEVFVAVVTTGQAPDYSTQQVANVRAEAASAHALLGVHETLWLEQPAARLSEISHSALNAVLRQTIEKVRPATMFVPFVGDIHMDHQRVFLSALVAARPQGDCFPTTILAYETLSETNWNAPYVTPGFVPNVFIDVTQTLNLKLEAMRTFASQLRKYPHERSLEAIEALAILRGVTVHRPAAEAFVLVRDVIPSESRSQGGMS